MNFHETRMGHTFFEHQIPQLISALQELTTAISQEKAPPVFRLPVDVPSDFLKELYYGNFEPDMEQDATQLREYNKPVMECHKRLKEVLAPEVWAQVEEYRHALDSRNSFEIEQAFETGFRSAVRLITAGLSVPPSEKIEQKRTEGKD